MKAAEQRARRMIAGLSTKKIVEQFELTETMRDPYIPTVRGWYMDELEKRNQKAFDEWLDSEQDSPRAFYL